MEAIINLFDIPREDSASSLKDSYLDLDYSVIHRAAGLA